MGSRAFAITRRYFSALSLIRRQMTNGLDYKTSNIRRLFDKEIVGKHEPGVNECNVSLTPDIFYV